ncbi:MAG: SDR family oxidoreductase [Halioglobus sp.]
MNNRKFNARSSADEVVDGHDLQGKNIIVTGANTGIGYETARALASIGGVVTLACRNTQAAAAACEKIRQQHPAANVTAMALDLSDLNSVVQFAKDYPADSISFLINNAGSSAPSLMTTAQGFERTVGVCHIGHFLLTELLMPKLLAAESPRVIMVSSESHRYPARLNFDYLGKAEGSYKSMRAYGQAKLCNVLMADELQRRYGDQGLTACSIHPGSLVTTDFGRESRLFRAAFWLASPFTKSPNQGASTTVYCALQEPASEIAGGYFSHCRRAKQTAEAKNPQVAAKLWALSEQWVQDFRSA